MSAPNESGWTEAEIAMLHDGIAQSLSPRAIGVIVGKSRNSVLGKAWRMGISFSGIRPKHVRLSDPLPHLKHAQTCAWPIGDPGAPGFHLCGCDRVAEGSYCAEHMQIAYTNWTPERGFRKPKKGAEE